MLENFFIHINVDGIALNWLSNQPLSRNRTWLGFLLLLVTRESDFIWFWSLWAESVVKKLYFMISYERWRVLQYIWRELNFGAVIWFVLLCDLITQYFLAN